MHIKDFFKRVKKHIVWGYSKKSPVIFHYLSSPNNEKQTYSEKDFIDDAWDKFRQDIIKDFNKNPEGFLRSKNIRTNLHPNQQRLSECYLLEMTKDSFTRQKIMPLLHDIPIGDPYISDCFPLASPLSLQHGYYHYMLNKYLDNLFDKKNALIVEFGGGYGNFCRLSYVFGYTGSYAMIDFPEMQHIQRYFLNHALPKHIGKNTIKFYDSINDEIFSKTDVKHPVLFFGSYSLGETQIETRKEVEKYYDKFDYIFLTYGELFDSVDNIAYFKNLKNSLSNKFDIQIIPDKYSKNCYFFLGKRKNNNEQI